jgi:hypothetical protein
MATLTVPIPEWEADQTSDGRILTEKKIKLRLGPVSLPDGSTFQEVNLGIGKAGLFTYRQPLAGLTEIWNEKALGWQQDPGAAVSTLNPMPLMFKGGDPFPWQAIILAVGQKTADDKDKFEAAGPPSFQYPRYSFRAYFETTGANGVQMSGLSGATAPIRFLVDSGESFLVGLYTDKKPEEAEQLHVFIKDTNRRVVGRIELERVGTTARIRIARLNASGGLTADVTLDEHGNILLNCPGKVIIQAPELETERIKYQPNAGGPKQYL